MAQTIDAQQAFDQAQSDLKNAPAPARALSSSEPPTPALPPRDPALARESLENVQNEVGRGVAPARCARRWRSCEEVRCSPDARSWH